MIDLGQFDRGIAEVVAGQFRTSKKMPVIRQSSKRRKWPS